MQWSDRQAGAKFTSSIEGSVSDFLEKYRETRLRHEIQQANRETNRYVVAGLDVRYGWTESMPPALQVGAFVLAAIAYGLVTWAMTCNSFFSMIYRIQAEREHVVASGGPYRYVRHPGYLGSALFELAMPIALDSWWAFIPGILAALTMIVRTAYEDQTLQDELAGYAEYSGQTRYRLLPGIW